MKIVEPNNHQWRCPTCGTLIGKDYDACPICEAKKETERTKDKFLKLNDHDNR